MKTKQQIANFYKNFSAIVWKEDAWFVAKCLEIEVASQGKTKKDALSNLTEALELYFEDEPKFEKLPSFKDLSLEQISIPSCA